MTSYTHVDTSCPHGAICNLSRDVHFPIEGSKGLAETVFMRSKVTGMTHKVGCLLSGISLCSGAMQRQDCG